MYIPLTKNLFGSLLWQLHFNLSLEMKEIYFSKENTGVSQGIFLEKYTVYNTS